jgi:hypothetical protein
MRLRVAIIDWSNHVKPVTFLMPMTAARFGANAQYMFTRITGRSLRYDFPAEAEVIRPSFPARSVLITGFTRNSSMAWWDTRRALIEYTGNPNALVDDVWLIWHNGNPRDVSGIGQPAFLPHREVRWNERADPNIGGLATNGRAQLTYGIEGGFRGDRYLMQLAYADHEVGHSLAVHHPGRDAANPRGQPASPEYLGETIMSYSYAQLARGTQFRGRYFNPKIALPEEIAVWRAHAAFEDIPVMSDATRPGWADQLGVVRTVDMRWMQQLAAGDTPPNEPNPDVARVTWGATLSDLAGV